MTCKECVHYDLCRSCSRIQLGWHGNNVRYVENVEEICKDFKDRSRFVELPYYKYTAEERFRGAVQELIDIAKASETPSKILRATSESLAHFACELSKLEETKQVLKERENNAD